MRERLPKTEVISVMLMSVSLGRRVRHLNQRQMVKTANRKCGWTDAQTRRSTGRAYSWLHRGALVPAPLGVRFLNTAMTARGRTETDDPRRRAAALRSIADIRKPMAAVRHSLVSRSGLAGGSDGQEQPLSGGASYLMVTPQLRRYQASAVPRVQIEYPQAARVAEIRSQLKCALQR